MIGLAFHFIKIAFYLIHFLEENEWFTRVNMNILPLNTAILKKTSLLYSKVDIRLYHTQKKKLDRTSHITCTPSLALFGYISE